MAENLASPAGPFDAHVVILNWNRAEDTLECLRSLAIQEEALIHILVVDNGSTDDSLERIHAEFPGVEMLPTGANLGFPGGMNAGICKALQTGAETILILNNDTIADPRLIRNLLDHFPSEYGCAAPLIYYAGAPDQPWSTGGDIHPLLLEMVSNRPVVPDRPTEKTFFTGCALLVRRSVFAQAGLFDERFYPGYYEDLDFSLRTFRAGIRKVLVPQAKLWHKISQSSGGSNSPQVRFLMARNSALYFRKHMRWWQAPAILGFRLGSTLKTALLLARRKDWQGLKAHGYGFLAGWLGIHPGGAKEFFRPFEDESIQAA